MTTINKQAMYREPSMSNLFVAVWASVVVSKYQDCNIDNKLKRIFKVLFILTPF